MEESAMRLVVASGKGGTGKTTVAVNLAVALSRARRPVTFLDADVEAPNGHLFLDPRFDHEEPVELQVPRIDEDLCTHCGQCAEFCEFSALVTLRDRMLFFPELCHSCGGCRLVCPAGAITEHAHRIGTVEEGKAGAIHYIRGRLDIGRPLSPPVIRAAQARVPAGGITIVDAPPGTACPAVQAVTDADFVLLVAEPTPFGIHDLDLAVRMVGNLGLPFAVVGNRADEGIGALREYCARGGIRILMEIPDDRRIATTCSRGELIVDTLPEYAVRFNDLFEQIESRVAA